MRLLLVALALAAGASTLARAQGVLLPPGDVVRPNGSLPGATQPTQSQLFSPQLAFPTGPAPAKPAPAKPAAASAAAPSTASAPQSAPAASAAPVPASEPEVASAAPTGAVPLPQRRPASADAAPPAGAPLALAPNAGGKSGVPRPPFQPQPVAPVQGDQDRASAATLEKVTNYWNGVQMLSGTFVQIDPDGSRKTGDFYMQKPGRVKFEYNAPVPLELISNGQSVAVRDRKLNTQDVVPLGQTPLRFLLAERINLANNPNLVGAYQDNLYVTIVMSETVPMVGTYKLMLLFDARDYTLKQWIVTDPQGYDTSVAIANLDYTRRPDPRLFVINFDRMIQ